MVGWLTNTMKKIDGWLDGWMDRKNIYEKRWMVGWKKRK